MSGSCVLLCFFKRSQPPTSWNNTQALQLHCHVLSVPTNYEWQHPQITLHTICSFLENRGININNTSSWPCVSGRTVKHNDFLCSILHSIPYPAFHPPPLFSAAPPSNFLQLLEVPHPHVGTQILVFIETSLKDSPYLTHTLIPSYPPNSMLGYHPSCLKPLRPHSWYVFHNSLKQ